MKLKFRHKVFLAFLLNSLLIVVCMLLIGRYYAHRNFEEYVVKVEAERVNELASVLGQEYRRSRSWELVMDNWGHWLHVTARGPGPHPRPDRAGWPPIPPPPPEPGPSMGMGPEGRGPPSFGESLPPHPPGPPPEHEQGPSHICLFDADKRPLTGGDGTSPDGYQLKPILVDEQLVGWLGTRKIERPAHPLDREFIRHQSQMFYWTGGAALVLALLVTLGLSRHLLAPVKQLAEGARALTSRRFDTRIEVRSGDELGELAADFNTMTQGLERYEQMRRQWIADIAHELRTPLAILRGEIEAMQDGVREVTPEALDSLHFEVLHVGRIVHDLHDLSLIESCSPDPEQTAVSPLGVLERTLKSFHTRLEQRGIRVEAEGGSVSPVKCGEDASRLEIMANADRLMQLFSNLIENTLRYADAPGVLRVSHEITAGSLFLHFEDSGPGVPEESLGRLFDRLYRVDRARSRALGGSGLGLAICRSIVECSGGRIEASTGASGGLRITMAFPVISS